MALRQKYALLGLGSNLSGNWGSRETTLTRATEALGRVGITLRATSSLYESPALGMGIQPDFLNSVIKIETLLPARELLLTLKEIERNAGRSPGQRWASRPLDIDILDYNGRILNWPSPGGTRRGGQFTLPHPGLHLRAFVLKPLHEIAPDWRHPVLRQTAQRLLTELDPAERHQTRRLPDYEM